MSNLVHIILLYWLQYVKAIVGPYQLVQSRVAMVKSATSPFWNEDLMFVAAEPFDELLHLLIVERVGNKVSGGDFASFFASTTTIVGLVAMFTNLTNSLCYTI